MTQQTQETFETIRQWAVSTFGEATMLRIAQRADEEMWELLVAAHSADDAATLEEAADVVITLCNLPGLQAAIDAKMAKNRARKWKVMGDGTGYHVKETPE